MGTRTAMRTHTEANPAQVTTMISKLVEVRIHVMMARIMPHRRPHRRLQLESGMSVILRRPTLNNSSVTLVLMTESLSFLCC